MPFPPYVLLKTQDMSREPINYYSSDILRNNACGESGCLFVCLLTRTIILNFSLQGD